MDCPQRDERLGWCGDAMVFSSTASWLMDTRAFYDKFCRDLRTDQKRNDGRVAIYLPNEFPGLTAAVWSDIATFLPQNLYTAYGDADALRRHYPLMRDWVDSVRRQDQARGEKYLWDFGFQFGDWLALDGATPQSTFGRTDVHFVSSVYYYASAAYVAKAAEALELPERQHTNSLHRISAVQFWKNTLLRQGDWPLIPKLHICWRFDLAFARTGRKRLRRFKTASKRLPPPYRRLRRGYHDEHSAGGQRHGGHCL